MMVKLNGNDFFYVSSKYGSIDRAHHVAHSGIDLVMNAGTKLFSPTDGVITKVVDFGNNNIGKGIYIETDNHQKVIMGHLSEAKVSVGQRVHEGDFVAYSGNTGHSTGAHLHLGLKDAGGHFINPQPLLNEKINEASGLNNVTGIWDFIQKWKQEGFWHAMYGKSFFQVMHDFFSQLGHDIGIFILGNGDLFFLLPAIVFLLGTWLIGRNKFTKWIIPLGFAYFLSRCFYYMIQ